MTDLSKFKLEDLSENADACISQGKQELGITVNESRLTFIGDQALLNFTREESLALAFFLLENVLKTEGVELK